MTSNEIQSIKCNEIRPGDNDRQTFIEGDLQSLAASIKEHGLAQPITVRPVWECSCCGRQDADFPEWCDDCENDTFWTFYQIVAGERRFRACSQILGWDTIPAIVRHLDDETASGIMLAENTGRADLDPIEEAIAYHKRMQRWGWDEATVADRAGVTVIRVRFRLKMLNLRPEIRQLVSSGDLQMGYAQILADAGLDTNRQMIALSRLRQNPSPTPAWFRSQVSELLEDQAQDSFIELLGVPQVVAMPEATATELPPLPGENTPPEMPYAGTETLIETHIAYWTEAAEGWDRLGKNFKRDQCLAAVTALETIAGPMKIAALQFAAALL